VIPHDAPVAGSGRAVVREREDAVVARLHGLGATLDGEPDAAFRAATRTRLVAMAAVRTPEPARVRRPVLARVFSARPEPVGSPWRRRVTAGLAGAAVAVTALATLVAVSSGAHPGQALYGLKRGTEQTQLALSGDERGLTLLGFAHTRLTELRALAPGADPDLVVDTVRTMQAQTVEGAAAVAARAVQTHAPAQASDLASWSTTQSDELAALRPRLPAASSPAFDEASALLARVAQRATELSTAVGCPSGPAVRGTDPLGPVPGTCATAPATPVQAGGGSAGGPSPVPGPATPPPGTTGTTGIGGSGGTTAGGSGTVSSGGVPAGTVSPRTGGGTPGLPTTGLGLPGTGSAPSGSVVAPPAIPLPTTVPGRPGATLPGTTQPGGLPTGSGGAGGAGGAGGTGLPGGVAVCLPPVTIGSC
jgi:hypothetical protein